MGYSQRAHVWYGWKVPSEPYKKWFAEIDYDMPEGVMLIGVDSLEVVFGVELFQSSDVRWDPLYGEVSFGFVGADLQFKKWFNEIKDERLLAALGDFAGPPLFHAFCNTT